MFLLFLLSIYYFCGMNKKEWFASWFDSPYYHMLYKNRDEIEAANFIKRLSSFLNLPAKSNVIDLACGKGRHSITLNKLGYSVLGLDLSANSICQASPFSNEHLHFKVHDMRNEIPAVDQQAVFNLFTSFGYFENISDNQKVMQAVYNCLCTEGYFVIDFMNVEKIIQTLVPKETKAVDHLTFSISRKYTGTHITKTISFEDKNTLFSFEEKVQALKFDDFEKLLSANHFQIIRTFGDFDLNDFNNSTSDRLIIIARKK